MLKKIVEIIYDLIVIGKSAAGDIQISGDVASARRIREAIKMTDMIVGLKRLRKELCKGAVYIEDEDIIDIAPIVGGAVVSADFLVRYRQLYKDLRRCRRAKGNRTNE